MSLRRLGGRHVHDRGQFARELCTRREASYQTREQRGPGPPPPARARSSRADRLWFMRGCLLSVENVFTQQPTLIKLTIEPQPRAMHHHPFLLRGVLSVAGATSAVLAAGSSFFLPLSENVM